MTQTWLITGSFPRLRTGAGRGGARSGDRVVATARRPEQLDDLVHDLRRPRPYDRARRHRPRGGPRRRPAGARRVRRTRRRREQRRLRQLRAHRGHARRRLPRPDRDEPVRRRQRHQGGAPGAARAALRPLSSSSPPSADASAARPGWAPTSRAKFARRGLLRSAQQRGKAASASRSSSSSPAASAPTGAARRCALRRWARTTSQTVGAMNRYREANDGNQPGDPARAARSSSISSGWTNRRCGSSSAPARSRPPRSRPSPARGETREWAEVSRSADFPQEAGAE